MWSSGNDREGIEGESFVSKHRNLEREGKTGNLETRSSGNNWEEIEVGVFRKRTGRNKEKTWIWSVRIAQNRMGNKEFNR